MFALASSCHHRGAPQQRCSAPSTNAALESAPRQVIQSSHAKNVISVAVSPAGLIASAGGEGTVRLWDADRRALLRTIPSPAHFYGQLAWTDPQTLVAINEDGSVVHADLDTGKWEPVLAKLPGNWNSGVFGDRVYRLPHGPWPWAVREMASMKVHTYLADAKLATQVELVVPENLQCLLMAAPAVSADGRIALAACTLMIADRPKDTPVPEAVKGKTFTDASGQQVHASGQMTRFMTRPIVWYLEGNRVTRAVALPWIAGDIKTVAMARDGATGVFTVELQEEFGGYETHLVKFDHGPKVLDLGGGSSMRFSEDSTTVFTGGASIEARRASDGELKWRRQIAGGIAATLVTGELIVTGRNGSLDILDAATGQPQRGLGARARRPEAFELAGDTLRVLTRGRTRSIADWSLRDGTVSRRATLPDDLKIQLGRDGTAATVLGPAPTPACPESTLLQTWKPASCNWQEDDCTAAMTPTATICPTTTDEILAMSEDGLHFANKEWMIELPGKVPFKIPSNLTLAGWEKLSGRITLTHPDKVVALENGDEFARHPGQWSFAGDLLVSPSGAVFDANTGKLLHRFQVARERWQANPAQLRSQQPGSVGASSLSSFDTAPAKSRSAETVVSRNGQYVALILADTVVVWDLSTGVRVSTATLPSGEQIESLAFVDNMPSLLVGTRSSTIYHVDRDGRQTKLVIGGGPIRHLVTDGTIAAASGDDDAIRIFDPRTLVLRATLIDFEDDEQIAFTPNGAYIGAVEVAERVVWVFEEPLEGFTFEQFATAYAKPEIVRRRLAGQNVDVAPIRRRPPSVRISGIDAATGRVSVRATAPGTLEDIRIYVEGRLQSTSRVCAIEGKLELDVPLQPGTNRVTAVASDTNGLTSNEVSRDIERPADPTVQPGLWVVAIGVDVYPLLPPRFQLGYAVKDAVAISETFEHLTGAGKPYTKRQITKLVNEKATRASIEAALDGLAAMKPDDVAIVSFSGHGIKLDEAGEMMLVTGGVRGTDLGVDAASASREAVAWGTIAARLVKAKGRVVVLLDACHSGHVSRDVIVRNDDLARALVSSRRSGVVVFAASKGRQLSFEPDGADKALVRTRHTKLGPKHGSEDNGLFTAALLDSLRAVATDRNRDKSIQLGEWIDDVIVRVTERTTGLQTPWVARRELFGDYRIAPTPSPPPSK